MVERITIVTNDAPVWLKDYCEAMVLTIKHVKQGRHNETAVKLTNAVVEACFVSRNSSERVRFTLTCMAKS